MTAPINNAFRDSSFQQFVEQIRKENSFAQEQTQKKLAKEREELQQTVSQSASNASRRIVTSVNLLKKETAEKSTQVVNNLQQNVNINKDILSNAIKSYKLVKFQTERLTNLRRWGFLFTNSLKLALYRNSPFLRYFNFAARAEVSRAKNEKKNIALNKVRYLSFLSQRNSEKLLEKISNSLVVSKEEEYEKRKWWENLFKPKEDKFEKNIFKDIFGGGKIGAIIKTAAVLGGLFGALQLIGKMRGIKDLGKTVAGYANAAYMGIRFLGSNIFVGIVNFLGTLGKFKLGIPTFLMNIFKSSKFGLMFRMLNKNSRIFGTLVNVMSKVGSFFTFLSKPLGILKGLLPFFKTARHALKFIPGLNLIVGGIYAIQGIFKGVGMADEVGVNKFVAGLTGAIGGLIDFFTFGMLDIETFMKEVAPSMQKILDGILLEDYDMVFDGIIDASKGIFQALLDSVVKLWEKLSAYLYEETKLGRWADSLVQTVTNIYSGIVNGLNSIIINAIEMLPAPLARKMKEILGMDQFNVNDVREGSYDLNTTTGRQQYMYALANANQIKFAGDDADQIAQRRMLANLETAEFKRRIEAMKANNAMQNREPIIINQPVQQQPASFYAPLSTQNSDEYLRTERQITNMR